jgi:hypothetical protein
VLKFQEVAATYTPSSIKNSIKKESNKWKLYIGK